MIRLSALMLCIVLIAAGCQDPSTGPAGGGTVSLSVKTVNSTTMLQKQHPVFGTAGVGIDSLRITRARVVLRNIRFKNSDDSLTFRTLPMVLQLELNGAMQQIGVSGVPPRTYREIEFEVHRVENEDMAMVPPMDRPQFDDFLAGERYSIIIEGTVYPNGNSGEPFVFRSRVNEEQEFEFEPPIVISDTEPTVNVTMLIDTGRWFRTPGGSSILDPRVSDQEQTINENIKSSIRIFEDNDHDGEDD